MDLPAPNHQPSSCPRNVHHSSPQIDVIDLRSPSSEPMPLPEAKTEVIFLNQTSSSKSNVPCHKTSFRDTDLQVYIKGLVRNEVVHLGLVKDLRNISVPSPTPNPHSNTASRGRPLQKTKRKLSRRPSSGTLRRFSDRLRIRQEGKRLQQKQARLDRYHRRRGRCAAQDAVSDISELPLPASSPLVPTNRSFPTWATENSSTAARRVGLREEDEDFDELESVNGNWDVK